MGLGGVNLANRMPMTQGVETGSNVTGTSMTGVNTTGLMQSAKSAGPIDAVAVNKMREQLLKFACNTLGVTGFDALPQSVKDALNVGVTEGQGDVLPLEKRMFLVMNAVDESNMMISPKKDLWMPKDMLNDMKRLAVGDVSVGEVFKGPGGASSSLEFRAAADAAFTALINEKGTTMHDLLQKLEAYHNQLGIAMNAALSNRTKDELATKFIPPEYSCAERVQKNVENLIKQIKHLGVGANKSVGPKEQPNSSASQDPSATRKSSAPKKSMQEMPSRYQELSRKVLAIPGKFNINRTQHIALADLSLKVCDGLDKTTPLTSDDIQNFTDFAKALEGFKGDDAVEAVLTELDKIVQEANEIKND